MQKATSPAWNQDTDSEEAIREAIDRALGGILPRPGTTIWMVDSVSGDDADGDGSGLNPYQTLGKAESVASIRDTILGWGSFIENIVLAVSQLRIIGLGNGISMITGIADNTPIIDLNHNKVEITGFEIWGTAKTGHGIRLVNAGGCYIHHNLIRDITGAYDGIDRSSGSNMTGRIEHNTIRDCEGAGIGFVNFIKGKIIGNTFLRNATGVHLSATCDYNEILDKKVFDNIGVGIHMQGDDNYIADNVAVGNAVSNLEDEGTDNRWEDNHTHQLTSDTHITTGIAEETVTSNRCIQPNARVKGYLRLNAMVAGDDFIFRVKKSYNAGVTWDIIDETNLVGPQLIDRYPFDVTLENKDEWVRIFIQRQSAVDRSFYYRKIFKEG